jgi:hypothetical protein
LHLQVEEKIAQSNPCAITNSIKEGVPVLNSADGKWDDVFKWDSDHDDEDDEIVDSLGLEGQEGEGIMFLEEAHEALNRLSQKTNKRGRVMKHPRRAESWH